MKLTLTLLALVILTGCASQYREVSPSKMLAEPPAVSDQTNSAVITIKRDKSVFMSALDGRVLFNEQHLVTLSSGETYTFRAVAGTHKLGVRSYQPIMFVPIPFQREIEVNLEAGKRYEYILKGIVSAGLGIEAVKN